MKLIAAKDIDVPNYPIPKVGDVNTFPVNGKWRAVEIISVVDSLLKIMSCDLELVWDNISITTWNRQLAFMEQLKKEDNH